MILRPQPTISGFVTAVELGHMRKRVVKISTGSKQLDSILGGSVLRHLIILHPLIEAHKWLCYNEYQ